MFYWTWVMHKVDWHTARPMSTIEAAIVMNLKLRWMYKRIKERDRAEQA